MASLGDFFADDQKNEFANQLVRVGAVVKIWLTTTIPPKEKRVVIVGITATGDYLGVVLINTNINWNVHRNPDMYDYQYFLRGHDCDFLDHDSYADCLNMQELPRSYVVNTLQNDLQLALGDVPDDLLNELISRVKTSPAISMKIRRKYGLI